MAATPEIKHIVILVHPYSALLNMAAPVEVFQRAIEEMEQPDMSIDFSYELHIVSANPDPKLNMKPCISLICESNYLEVDYRIDTLIVVGAPRRNGFDPKVLDWLKRQSKKVRRICSMCAGAFILAEAGILNNKKAVTHWQLCDEMARKYPQIEVEKDPIFIRQGNVYTSAGVTAGLDLSLALIEEDLGKAFALHIARMMVLFLKRPGNQTQFSVMLDAQKTDYLPITKVIDWIHNHLEEDITVEKLAETASMSPRNFARVFARELNTTPIKYVEKIRIETACRYLTDSHLTIDEIAHLTGFKSSLNMNRIFLKTFNTNPSQYRKNFSTSFSHPNQY
ncbi:AraC family transcriptional regulator [Arachidicoccus ginsenosidimutans]|uniref:GlxA family transcriptional regulator n=1 Tax=Arachidicoccus sp. BS20 TaxID=1850526 RepID=UPI0007F166FE|nr:helix-turn-helix domain-containing protein [Arachidicoccus sp. BS20]ANI89780.1 AraC family transcriptional regulator [Arachidicoccus sp. BS20]